MSLRRFFTATCLSLSLISAATGAETQERKAVVERLAKGISSARVHKIYVPDFTDSSGQPSDLGAFFAAMLSQSLTTKSTTFTVQGRTDAHAFLLQNNLSDYALADGSVLAKFSSQFGVDAILWGTVKSTATDHIVELKLKDLTGKELFTDSYGEPSELTSGEFPATTSSGGWPYYFLGLDGVSAPKCYYMSNPPYPEEVRKDRISGVIVLSGLVTTQGTVDETRIVKSLGSKLDALSLQTVSTWRCKPAKSPNGTPIPLRVPFQITFKLY